MENAIWIWVLGGVIVMLGALLVTVRIARRMDGDTPAAPTPDAGTSVLQGMDDKDTPSVSAIRTLLKAGMEPPPANTRTNVILAGAIGVLVLLGALAALSLPDAG